MAKDNLFLGTARGSVGDIVFSRLDGQQVARVRNRAPRNPQSPAQMVQRIIMSTVGKAYSLMQEITNHSFEGFEQSQGSQRKFMEVNVSLLRDVCADVLAYPVEEIIKTSQLTNFSFKNDYSPVLNRYMISAGSLPSMTLLQESGGSLPRIPFDPGEKTQSDITYGDIISLLNLQRGDQLTFIQVTADATMAGRGKSLINGFRIARVILDPSDGDLASPFFAENNSINKPNERNSGSFSTLFLSTTENSKGIAFALNNVEAVQTSSRALAASALILSRQIGGRWLRSTQFLEPRTAAGPVSTTTSYLGEAYMSYLTGSASDLYLNQAE
jgi:hypothetical protein